MKYLTQILIKEAIRKVGIYENSIAILDIAGELSVNNIVIENGVFDFVNEGTLFYVTKKQESNLIIFQDFAFFREVTGSYYLTSFRKVDSNRFAITNGYKEDGFHHKYVLVNQDTFKIEPFFGFNVSLDQKFIVNRGFKICAYDFAENLLWETDISTLGEYRYDSHARPLDISTPNSIMGNIMGFDGSVALVLKGLQIIGLDANDGSVEWIHEGYGNHLTCQNGNFIYAYYLGSITEINMHTGKITRTLDLNPFLADKRDSIFCTAISNGKLILDFNHNYSNLAVIDLAELKLESFIDNAYRSIMLRVSNGNVIWNDNKVYARDPLSNILYVYGDI